MKPSERQPVAWEDTMTNETTEKVRLTEYEGAGG